MVIGTPYGQPNEYENNGRILGNIFDEHGQKMLPKEFVIEDLSDISGCEDIILVIENDTMEPLYGYFDRQSGFFCYPQFECVSLYNNNEEPLIAISKDGKWGFCNRSNGDVVIACQYEEVYRNFSNGYAIVVQTEVSESYYEEYILIDRHGKIVIFPDHIIPITTPNIAGKLVIADCSNESPLYGIADTTGAIVVGPCYEEITVGDCL